MTHYYTLNRATNDLMPLSLPVSVGDQQMLHPNPIIHHDWLYTTGAVSRAEADAVYYAMLRHFGYGPVDASVNYLAVRLFGSRHYGRRAA